MKLILAILLLFMLLFICWSIGHSVETLVRKALSSDEEGSKVYRDY